MSKWGKPDIGMTMADKRGTTYATGAPKSTNKVTIGALASMLANGMMNKRNKGGGGRKMMGGSY